MVVQTRGLEPSPLDLGYLAFFLGLRVNALVMKRYRRAGFKGVRESHGYLVQHLIEADRSITELARRMNVTQQAASKTVAELVSQGILEARPAKDRRAKRIGLSPRGRDCVHFGRRARKNLENSLVTAAGRKNYEQAKSVLWTCLEALGGVGEIRSRRIRMPR
jgi:DNA-binding MarR family transcriptional regulator